MLICVCLRILASSRIPRYDLGRQTPHFWGGSVTVCLCVCLCILASSRILQYDLRRQISHFWDGTVTVILCHLLFKVSYMVCHFCSLLLEFYVQTPFMRYKYMPYLDTHSYIVSCVVCSRRIYAYGDMIVKFHGFLLLYACPGLSLVWLKRFFVLCCKSKLPDGPF
jgi:hypothetical protein